MLNEPKNATIEELKVMWNGIAPVYTTFDATMQTFYYTLASMMKIPEANHIFEVGCGIGKMIPYTLSLKREDCTYLATDLSEKMVEMSRNYLSGYTHKLGLCDSFDKWMERMRLEIGVHDGESMFKPAYKFDRMICNLVLMNTNDAHKMMQSMHEMADEGCLLGVSVWGDKKMSNFMNLPMEAKISLGKPVANVRDNFYLYNKLEQLGKETGWEMMVQWEQSSPLNSIENNAELTNVIKSVSELDASVMSYVEKKVKETFGSRKVLNFPVQMAIFRKK